MNKNIRNSPSPIHNIRCVHNTNITLSVSLPTQFTSVNAVSRPLSVLSCFCSLLLIFYFYFFLNSRHRCLGHSYITSPQKSTIVFSLTKLASVSYLFFLAKNIHVFQYHCYIIPLPSLCMLYPLGPDPYPLMATQQLLLLLKLFIIY